MLPKTSSNILAATGCTPRQTTNHRAGMRTQGPDVLRLRYRVAVAVDKRHDDLRRRICKCAVRWKYFACTNSASVTCSCAQ